MEYEFWKVDIINKIEIDYKKFNNNYKKKTYIFNCLENDSRNQAKTIVFVYLKVHQSYSF